MIQYQKWKDEIRLLITDEQNCGSVQIAGIEFNKEESESFVLDWYLRNGYKPFDEKSNLLTKKLKG